VQETAVRAAGQAREIMRIREEYRRSVQDKPKAMSLIDQVLRTPFVTVAEAQRVLGVSNPTARPAVNELVRVGLLEEFGDRRWRRLYVARPVLDALSASLADM
jgi:Fic family protein